MTAKNERGKYKRTTKAEAIQAICDFGIEEQAEYLQKGNKRRARMIKVVRKQMATAMLVSAKNLRETLEAMTEPITIESGKRAGQKTYDVVLYIKDDELRDMVRRFRNELFSNHYGN